MALPAHPHGVEPEGNLLLLGREACLAAHSARVSGLGNFFGLLNDSTLLRICSFATPEVLAALCATSDIFSAFASFEEHWRVATLRKFTTAPLSIFCSSWKATYLNAVRTIPGVDGAPPPPARTRTRGVSVFSDALFLPHQLTFGPNHFGTSPRGPPIARIAKGNIEGFSEEFEKGWGRPVVIEGFGEGSVGAGSRAWDESSLRTLIGERVFHAGGVNFRLSSYLDYARNNTDE